MGVVAGLAALVVAGPGASASAQTAPTTRGLTNPTMYACGITIGDGNVHTVGTAPVGSCFFGITTLAQLAQIPIGGVNPFSFVTDPGTQTGPLGTYAGTVNPFTSATGAYKLTDASVPNLDIAWLAIQAAAISGAVYLPTGNYVIGSAMPLPIMINTHFDGAYGNGDMLLGDGSQRSILVAGSSFGTLPDGLTHIPLLACGDPGATPTNQLGRWYLNNGQCNGTLQGFGLHGSAAATNTGLSSTYATDGLALGARLATVDVESDNFYHDITFVGDHTLHINLHANGGVFGAYWAPPNHVLSGDWQFLNFSASGQSFASLRVDGATAINGTFEGET
jgi:hypothetical protein